MMSKDEGSANLFSKNIKDSKGFVFNLRKLPPKSKELHII